MLISNTQSNLDPISYQVTFKPNCALTTSQKKKVVLLLTVIPCCIAIGFVMIGMWLVLPFVAFAFYYVNSHESDFERISIAGDSLLVERGTRQGSHQYQLNPYWVKVIRRELANGELRLSLLSHGREIEVGRYLTKEQREILAEQLQKRTGMFK
jgi:uncharacterized membrane protein